MDETPVDAIMVLPQGVDVDLLVLTIPQISDLLGITPSTLRGWITRKQFPPCDEKLDGRTSLWKLKTVIEYVRNAPGGRLGYPVG